VSGHPATFHDEVPRRCIAASTVEGDIVLDPFSGSGTTCKVAKLLNRQYIGFEISEEYHSLSEKNIHKLV
jgi:DNA modification methylase